MTPPNEPLSAFKQYSLGYQTSSLTAVCSKAFRPPSAVFSPVAAQGCCFSSLMCCRSVGFKTQVQAV